MKNIPLSVDIIYSAVKDFGSPLYIYDEKGIIETTKKLQSCFDWLDGYKNYFAVKACPTPKILKLLHQNGMGFDCSSYTELRMMQDLGVPGEDIFYTSNNTAKKDFELAIKLGAIVNIDDVAQVPVFLDALNGRTYSSVAVRYNPGKQHDGNDIIGKPWEAKYGMSSEQMIDAFTMLSESNIKEFGIHTMIVSNETNSHFFEKTAALLSKEVDKVERATKCHISFVNLGGGFGIPYKLDDSSLDLAAVSASIKKKLGSRNLRIYTENGRFITGPHGYLVTAVRYVMDKHKKYIGVDASMHNLMRPGMYGAYHHISVLRDSDHSDNDSVFTCDVVGSLCENNDKFAIDRVLPVVNSGDLLVIHDVGAHGYAMGFNYNGLLKCPEILVHTDKTTELIRKAETYEDYTRTMIWE